MLQEIIDSFLDFLSKNMGVLTLGLLISLVRYVIPAWINLRNTKPQRSLDKFRNSVIIKYYKDLEFQEKFPSMSQAYEYYKTKYNPNHKPSNNHNHSHLDIKHWELSHRFNHIQTTIADRRRLLEEFTRVYEKLK